MVHNITVPNWTIPQASLETRSNFSCIALNKGGQSRPAFDFVNVEAPPALIPQDNTPYKGVLYSSQNMTLTCRIECSPVCSIKWYKDHEEIDFDRDPLYYVVNTTHPADYKKNDFESIESILVPGVIKVCSCVTTSFTGVEYEELARQPAGQKGEQLVLHVC